MIHTYIKGTALIYSQYVFIWWEHHLHILCMYVSKKGDEICITSIFKFKTMCWDDQTNPIFL